MKTVTIHQAKTQLSKLIQEVLGGEEVVIAKGNRPIIKLVLLETPGGQRRLGRAKGKVVMADDFDDELTDFQNYLE